MSQEFNWPVLPDHIKRNVVNYLSYEYRQCLRKCSKSDQEIVDSCPVFMKRVGFKPYCWGKRIPRFEMYDSDSDDNGTYDRKVVDRYHGIYDFLRIFDNRKSKAEKVFFDIRTDEYGFNLPFLSKFIYELEARGPEFKIRCQFFTWRCHEGCDEYLLPIFKRLDTDHLKIIQLDGVVPREKITELAETEQWKKTKEFKIKTGPVYQNLVQNIGVEFDQIIHADKFQIKVYPLDANEVWKVIKSFRSFERPVGSFFSIDARRFFKWENVLELFDVPPKNERAHSLLYFDHTQWFRMESQDHILVVTFSNRGVNGVVCRENHLEEDYEKQYPNYCL